MNEIINLIEEKLKLGIEGNYFNYFSDWDYSCIGFYEYFKMWMDYYKGSIGGYLKNIRIFSTDNCDDIANLSMAKTICEEWASLLNYPSIFTDKEEINEYLKEVFKANNFEEKFQNFIEKTFATGNGILTVDIVENYPQIREVYMWNTIPLQIINNKITKVLFVGSTNKIANDLYKTKCAIYHNREDDLTDILEFEIYSQNETISMNDRIEILEESTGINLKLFHYFKPNIVNNINLDNPLGISVFANALDILNQIDLEYDSFRNDFVIAKMKMIMAKELMQEEAGTDEQGNIIYNTKKVVNSSIFVANYETIDKDSDQAKPIVNDLMKEVVIPIRTNEHIEAIQFQLNLLSQKCGLGSGFFKFDTRGTGITKTATEVISQKSELFKNKKKHEVLLKESLYNLVDDIIKIGIKNKLIKNISENSDYKILIEFDDSIANDDNTIRKEMRKDVSLGILSKKYYLMNQYKLTEEEAMKMLEQTTKENNLEIMDKKEVDELFSDEEVD